MAFGSAPKISQSLYNLILQSVGWKCVFSFVMRNESCISVLLSISILYWLKVGYKVVNFGPVLILCCLLLTALYYFQIWCENENKTPFSRHSTQMSYNSWFMNDAKIFAVHYGSIWIGVKRTTTSKLSIFYWFPFKCIHWKTGPIFNLLLLLIVIVVVLCAVRPLCCSATIEAEFIQVKWFVFEFSLVFSSRDSACLWFWHFMQKLSVWSIWPPLILHFLVHFAEIPIPKPSQLRMKERKTYKSYVILKNTNRMWSNVTWTNQHRSYDISVFILLIFNFNFYILRCLHQHSMVVQCPEFANYVGICSCLPNHLIFYVNYSVL